MLDHVGINCSDLPAAAAFYDQTLGAIREVVQGYPGIEAELQTYLQATGSAAFS